MSVAGIGVGAMEAGMESNRRNDAAIEADGPDARDCSVGIDMS